MKNILIALAIITAGYQGWNSFSQPTSTLEPLYQEPYVIVYGRTTCGFTQQTIKDLKRNDIPFEFMAVDNQSVADQLHSRMRVSGIDTSKYNLPVVDVSNNLSVRPNLREINDNL